MVFIPTLQKGRIFKDDESAKIWISDDSNRALIKVETKILVGTISVMLNSVKNVKFSNKVGGNYSQFAYDMDAATQNQVIYPSLDPSVFELRYPNEDIKGRVVPL